MRRRFLPALLVLLITSASRGQGPRDIPGAQLVPAPTIDGRISPGEWAQASPFSGLIDEETGTPAPEAIGGKFYLGYDEKYIYFAAQMTAPDPKRIAADAYRNNSSLSGNDYVGISLDPFAKLSDFSRFSANANGATSISISGGRAAKVEWQGEIVSRGRITDVGYDVEMRIPWAIMTLPESGERTVRFNVNRYVQQSGRSYVWRYYQGDNFDNTGVWMNVKVPAIPVRRSIDFLPFVYGGLDKDQDAILNSGIDFKAGISREITAVGTLNPDFRNIESQVLGLDFSYFERLAGESRPFFQEGRGFFENGGWQRLFASQRVPRLDLGAKVFGKVSAQTDVGLMSLSDYGREQVVVGRVGQQFSPQSNGSLFVASLKRRGEDNVAVRGNFHKGLGNYGIFGSGAYTEDQIERTGGAGELGAYYGWNGLNANISFSETSPRFFPRLGFWPERDYRSVNASIYRSQVMSRRSLGETEFGFEVSKAWRTNGTPYRQDVSANGSLTWSNGLDLDFGGSISEFEDNDDWMTYVGIERPRRDPYRRWSVNLNRGFVDGKDYRNYGINLSYRPFPRVQTNLSGQYVEHYRKEKQVIFTTNWDIGYSDTIGGRMILKGDEVGGYVSFRRSGATGAEYFLIIGDPSVVRWRGQVILKAVFPFSLKI